MECRCGGNAKTSKNEKTKKGEVVALLTFMRCDACGMVGTVSYFKISKKTGELEFVESGPSGPYWEKYGF